MLSLAGNVCPICGVSVNHLPLEGREQPVVRGPPSTILSARSTSPPKSQRRATVDSSICERTPIATVMTRWQFAAR
jgi:hypothetical protein